MALTVEHPVRWTESQKEKAGSSHNRSCCQCSHPFSRVKSYRQKWRSREWFQWLDMGGVTVTISLASTQNQPCHPVGTGSGQKVHWKFAGWNSDSFNENYTSGSFVFPDKINCLTDPGTCRKDAAHSSSDPQLRNPALRALVSKAKTWHFLGHTYYCSKSTNYFLF